MTDPRRLLPGVDQALASAEFEPLLDRAPRALVTECLRDALQRLRSADRPEWEDADQVLGLLARAVAAAVDRALAPSLRPVLNATGVILHTNLGRAPLSRRALEAVGRLGGGYTNLEYSLAAGRRGSRYDHCRDHLVALTGAEDALVVNNAAAALVLCLNDVAAGRGVVVSRGELIEIGGGFRIPEMVERAGTRLVEVGTTNRTRLADYAAALEDPGVAALLKVHRSNFRVRGFTEEVGVEALVDLARGPGLPVIHDLGSGLMAPLDGLPPEPSLAEAVAAGADLVVASGDKLLGGPQAGLILGRAERVAALRRNPLTRALRVDKLILAALEATLLAYREETAEEIPVLAMLRVDAEALAERTRALGEAARTLGYEAVVVPGASTVGGGTLPDAEIPGPVLAVTLLGVSAHHLSARMRRASPPIVTRIQDDRVRIDLRTVAPESEQDLLQGLRTAASDEPGDRDGVD